MIEEESLAAYGTHLTTISLVVSILNWDAGDPDSVPLSLPRRINNLNRVSAPLRRILYPLSCGIF